MISAHEYLRIEQENAFRHPRHGFDLTDVADASEAARAFNTALRNEAALPGVIEEIPGGGLNPRQSLHHMARTLHDDIRARLSSELHPRWDETVVGFLPTGVVNGCVFRNDGRGNALDRYLITLNYGLFFGCGALADALTLEILEGELAAYAADGSSSFVNAIRLYLSPTLDAVRQAQAQSPVFRNWPPEVPAQFAVRSGALISIMLQFVALHEFGHVVNGDVDSPNGVKRFSVLEHGNDAVEYRRSRSEAQDSWPCEFAADEFAVRNLCDWNHQAPSRWPNLAQVYLFFGWLEQVEREHGRPLCPYHPSPRDRKQAIVKQAFEIAPDGPPDDYFQFIDGRIAAWVSNAVLRTPTTAPS